GAMNENIELSGNDFRSILPCFGPEAMKANQALVDLLKQSASARRRRWRRSRLPGCWRREMMRWPFDGFRHAREHLFSVHSISDWDIAADGGHPVRGAGCLSAVA